MNNKVSLLLVADDRTFLSQVDRAGQRGGDLAGKSLVNRLQASTSQGLQNWKIPNTESVGKKAGKDIGQNIADVMPVMVAKKKRLGPYEQQDENERAAELGISKEKLAEYRKLEKQDKREIANQRKAAKDAQKQQASQEKSQGKITNSWQGLQTQLINASQELEMGDIKEASAKAGKLPIPRNFNYEAQRQAVNNKFDDKYNKNTQAIEKLGIKRNDEIRYGRNDGANYLGQINVLQAIIQRNEELRKSELRVLEIQKAQNKEVAKRKPTQAAQKPVNSKENGLASSFFDPTEIGQDPLVKKALELRAAQNKKAAQGAAARQKSQNQVNNANQQLESASLKEAQVKAGTSQVKGNLEYQSDRQAINDKFNRKRTENLQTIEQLKKDRASKILLGGADNLDYSGQIKAIEEVIAKNEQLRQSELKILEIQKVQNDVLTKRKTTDQRLEASRTNRDQKITGVAGLRYD